MKTRKNDMLKLQITNNKLQIINTTQASLGYPENHNGGNAIGKCLPIYFFSVSGSNDMNYFLSSINFIDNSVFALAERVTAFFIAFKWFTAVGLRGEIVNAVC